MDGEGFVVFVFSVVGGVDEDGVAEIAGVEGECVANGRIIARGSCTVGGRVAYGDGVTAGHVEGNGEG